MKARWVVGYQQWIGCALAGGFVALCAQATGCGPLPHNTYNKITPEMIAQAEGSALAKQSLLQPGSSSSSEGGAPPILFHYDSKQRRCLDAAGEIGWNDDVWAECGWIRSLTKSPSPAGSLEGFDLRGIRLQGLTLSKRISFKSAILEGADLSFAKLSGVDFTGADLTDANLQGVRAMSVNLSNSNLSRADLSMSRFCRGVFEGAKLDEANQLGMSHECPKPPAPPASAAAPAAHPPTTPSQK